MNFDAVGRTDRGGRDRNEDAFFIGSDLLVVADGMGTMGISGIEPSELAIAVISDAIVNGRSLGAALEEANAAIAKKREDDPTWIGVATELVAVHAVGDQLRVAHAGTCRAYARIANHWRPLTEDHTLERAYARWGLETKDLPKNVVMSAAGMGDAFHFQVVALPSQDCTIMLCSDGLWHAMEDAEIGAVLDDSPDTRTAVDTLVTRARDRGGDNVTVIVARVAP
jgi:serine/threonine protein phosphatase PrpC